MAPDLTGARGIEASQRLIDAGNALEDAGDFSAALDKYRAAVAATPDYIRAYLNVGNALQHLGRHADAVTALRSALRIDPDSAPCHFNLGQIQAGMGDLAAAESALRTARRLDPAMTDAAIALASVLESQKRPEDAEKELRQVMAAATDCAPAAYNLALLLSRRDEVDEAERMFRACVDADPAFLPAFKAQGDLIRNSGRSREAEAWYRRVLSADPRAQDAWSALLMSLNNRDDVSAQDVAAEHFRFGAAFPETGDSRTTRRARARAHSRIRVGYVSGDFIQHPVALFLRPVLEHRDRGLFEVFCYSNNTTEDWMTREIRSRADHWRNIAAIGDAAAAPLVRADQLDVLIDLSGHAARSRILLFNHGCAPVQATWMGYLNTTGLAAADFRISDAYADPVGMTEHLHSEKLLRLPDSQWIYAPVLDFPRAPMPARAAADGVIFGSFNHPSKISPRSVALWSRVMHAAPGSRLRICNVPRGNATHALYRQFEQHGIERDRIAITLGMNIDAYFAAIGDVDVALDTVPYNGGTTTFDTLWMEVPVVALAGDRPVARSGVSILSTLRLPELIAASEDDYVAINARLAADVEWRRTLRGTLRARMRASPLMDAPRFVRHFEDGLRQMLDESRSA